ncbi:dienelactone hydrolase family protein [Williamsia sp. CHRR-6]|uniref:dienelactone hydrolase family protein n=1 Tax=Williamsia sp. CHRR-6 TaxID=2835871 RepID=UPI001BDB23DC|nr:dienelactone hydrolase family protein [Williamsia sp. CHRR-6]MBT0566502.1 dienelactone hydrolase family protein [Williamsia sp. CHRR-6]
MTELKQYIAEEIATDHVEGLLSRREAMRRLGLIGLSAASASALIAACGSDSGSSSSSSSSTPASAAAGSGTASAPGMSTAVATEAITFTGPRGPLQGAWAPAASAKGAVIVLHENKGLTDHIRSVAGRLAGAGYSALAIDLLSEEGGTATFSDPAQATAALAKASPDRFTADMKAGVAELRKRVPDKKIGAIGFCFGGGLVWTLLASGEPQLSAAVPFYGPLPDKADFAGSKQAAVLAVYAALDKRVNASMPAAEAALKAAGMTNTVVTVPGVDHAFFNDTGQRYNAQAAAQIYQQVLDWFGEYLG